MAAGSSARSDATPELFTTGESEDDSDENYSPTDSSDDSSDHGNSSEEENSEETGSENDVVPPRRKRLRQPDRLRPGVGGNERVWVDGDFSPTLFDFDPTNAGLNPELEITEDISEIECFRLLFNRAVMEHLVTETNRFYDYVIAHTIVKENSRLHKWKPTTIEEMYVFFGVYMLMSHQKKMKMANYWSKDPLIHTPIFGHLMSSDRFFLLLRLIHFSDNEQQVEGDRLSKIKPVMELILDNFHYVLSPNKEVCIDESLMLWKGRLAFKQYIPSKRHRFGLKLFVICDVLTGYVLDFLVYTGSTTQYTVLPEPPLGITGAHRTTHFDSPKNVSSATFLKPQRKNAQRDSAVCSNTTKRAKKRKESRYMCSVCDVGLCVVPCFEEYHTLLHF